MQTVALRQSEVTDLTREGLSFLMCAEASIHYAIQQLSRSARLHRMQQGLHTSLKTVV